jgi:hypothetical protein
MDLGPRAKQDTTQGGRACCSIALKIGSGAGIHAPFHGPQHLTYQLPSGRMLLENSKPQLSASLQCVLLHTHASGSSSRTASGCLNPALCHVQSSSSLANFALPCSGANSPFGDPKRASRAGRRASLPKRAARAARDGISPSSLPKTPPTILLILLAVLFLFPSCSFSPSCQTVSQDGRYYRASHQHKSSRQEHVIGPCSMTPHPVPSPVPALVPAGAPFLFLFRSLGWRHSQGTDDWIAV